MVYDLRADVECRRRFEVRALGHLRIVDMQPVEDVDREDHGEHGPEELSDQPGARLGEGYGQLDDGKVSRSASIQRRRKMVFRPRVEP